MMVMRNVKTSGYQGNAGSSLRAVALRNDFDGIKSNNTYLSYETLQNLLQETSGNSNTENTQNSHGLNSNEVEELLENAKQRAIETATGDLRYQEELNDEVSTIVSIENSIWEVSSIPKNDVVYTVDKTSTDVIMSNEERVNIISVLNNQNESVDQILSTANVISEQFRCANVCLVDVSECESYDIPEITTHQEPVHEIFVKSMTNVDEKTSSNDTFTPIQVETIEDYEVVQNWRKHFKFSDKDIEEFLDRIKVLYGFNKEDHFDGGNVIVNIYHNINAESMQPNIFWENHASGIIDENGNIVGGRNLIVNRKCITLKSNTENSKITIDKYIGYVKTRGTSGSTPSEYLEYRKMYNRPLIMLKQEELKKLMFLFKENKKKFEKMLLKTALATAPFRKRYPIFRKDEFLRFGSIDEPLKENEEMQIPKTKLVFV